MNESFKKVIDEYKTVPPAKTLLINALKEIKPDKKNWGVWVYSGILALVFSIGIGFHEETVEVFRRIYPQFCVNVKGWCKIKVDRGGVQGSLFAALIAMTQKSCSLSRAAAQPLFIYP